MNALAREPLGVRIGDFMQVADALRKAIEIAELAILTAENHGASAHVTKRLHDLLDRLKLG